MTREFSRSIKSKGIIISETTPWGWHGIKQPSGTHNTINYFANPGIRVMGKRQRLAVLRRAVNPFPCGKHYRFNSYLSHYSVRIMLFACRRSMIQLNLHRSSCAETNDINGRTETTCDYAQTTHGKRLLLILLTGGRSEKHNGMYLSWESGGRIVLDAGGSSPPFPISNMINSVQIDFQSS